VARPAERDDLEQRRRRDHDARLFELRPR
jgi:hypothetical protein